MDYCAERINNGVPEETVWKEFDSISAELDNCLCQMLDSEESEAFVVTVMRMREKEPKVTAYDVFRDALELGLALLLDPTSKAARKPKKAIAKSRVRGV